MLINACRAETMIAELCGACLLVDSGYIWYCHKAMGCADEKPAEASHSSLKDAAC